MTARFGEWLMKTREKQRHTYESLAEKSGVSKASLYSIEAGTTRPRIDTADKICKGLGLPLWKALKQIGAIRGKRSAAASRERA